MPIVVTDEMVQAARCKMPARWSMQDLHDAIEAALVLASPFELTIDLEPSEEQREEFARKLREQFGRPDRLLTEPCVPSGIELMPTPAAEESEPVHTIVLDCRGLPARLTHAFVDAWNGLREADPLDPRPLLAIAPPMEPELDALLDITDEFPLGTPTLDNQISNVLYAMRLGGVSEIADAIGVARSTVSGWIKRADAIGMPKALVQLTAGPVYDLDVVEAWYRQWKDTSDAAA